MEDAFLLLIAALTSVGIYLLGARGLRLRGAHLWKGLGKTCEIVGLTLVFFALNLIVGVVIVYVARQASGRFVSLYHLSDTTVLVVSLLQAMIFQGWRAVADRRHGERLGSDYRE